MNEMQTHLPIFDVSQRLCNGVGEIFSVAWEGECKEKMVVIGDGVDVDTLTRKLKKKLCYAKLLLVQEVKVVKPVDKKEVIKVAIKETIKEEKKVITEVITEAITKAIPERTSYCSCKQQLCTQPSYPVEYRLCGPVVYGYEDPSTGTCNIM